MTVTIYHNPRCSKSRQALQILRDNGVEPEVMEYLKTPPDAAVLQGLIDKLNIPAHDVLRTKEDEYTAAGLSPQSSDAQIIKAIEAHPILLERPIVVKGEKAVIGRPPEKIGELL